MSSAFGGRLAIADLPLTVALLISVVLHAVVLVGSRGFIALSRGQISDNSLFHLSVTLKRAGENSSSLEKAEVDANREIPSNPPAESGRALNFNERVVEKRPGSVGPPGGDEGGAALLLPHYFTLSELDLPPYAIDDVNADSGALDLPESGKIVLELWVNNVGSVDRVDVVELTVPDSAVAGIKEVFSRTRFVPARKQGVLVHSRVRIEIVFAPPQVMHRGRP